VRGFSGLRTMSDGPHPPLSHEERGKCLGLMCMGKRLALPWLWRLPEQDDETPADVIRGLEALRGVDGHRLENDRF
jgi:hypothetical protein